MNIKKESIQDISSTFEPLITSFEDINYVVWIEARSFYLTKNKHFSLNDLELLFPDADRPIVGNVTLEKYNFIKKSIFLSFSYKSDKGGSPCQIKSHILAHSRSKIFWDMVANYVSIPPEKVYIFEPLSGSYFCGWIFWGLCFVLLDKEKGVAFYLGSSD